MSNTLIEVSNGRDVFRFEGSKIAHVSAELATKPRWSEFNLYLSVHGEFILQGAGRTRVPGEQDRLWVVISKDPLDVIDSIIGTDASRLAKKLLAESLAKLVAPVVP